MSLFIGKINPETRTEELEGLFTPYGKLSRCDIKTGSSNLNYGFVEFEDPRDAEDAVKQVNGIDLHGEKLVVEYSRGKNRVARSSECFRCGREGHFARDCSSGGGSYRRDRSPYDDRRRYRSRSRDREPRRYRSRSRSRSRDRHSRRRDESPRRRDDYRRDGSPRRRDYSPRREDRNEPRREERRESPRREVSPARD